MKIIEGLEEHHSLKEIAHLTGMSQSNVNKQISNLKTLLNARSHREIIVNYHRLTGLDHGTKTADRFSHLPSAHPIRPVTVPNEAGLLHFADAGAFAEQPWANVFEPQIVPRWLDGDHFVLARLGAIVGLLILMLAMPVLGVATLDSIAEILQGSTHASQRN
ncbi:MAG: hypothetical protein ACKOQ3_01000 [Novosphingobium sp.]